ncbi:response regulator transcription factor [Alkalicoccobacillus gibsonii]|uniref:response regulator transcription factor n=1 Tax=Alkalicoccobacillus gibsonii TaxID=79881 RepID=UPI001933B735|nr:helix-turn-helix transcriptional regulator [Alkalicoccobacillus gibsonii]MBM0067922.1 helix-turn-helix transcriptional regulator [Alkalicoccobacillus gibsonii]
MGIKELSNRERDVAVLVAKGKKDVEIAKILFISRRRVGELIFNIKEKWRLTSRVEIGIGAYYFGWLNDRLNEEAVAHPFYTTTHMEKVQT